MKITKDGIIMRVFIIFSISIWLGMAIYMHTTNSPVIISSILYGMGILNFLLWINFEIEERRGK